MNLKMIQKSLGAVIYHHSGLCQWFSESHDSDYFSILIWLHVDSYSNCFWWQGDIALHTHVCTYRNMPYLDLTPPRRSTEKYHFWIWVITEDLKKWKMFNKHYFFSFLFNFFHDIQKLKSKAIYFALVMGMAIIPYWKHTR